MNIWLVTTGSSDVQLLNDDLWQDWRRELEGQWNRLPFEPKQLLKDADEPYRIPPRVLGIVYDAHPEEVWECLTFPLLQAFNVPMQEQHIDKVILLLTDQENVFDEDSRSSIRCPFWQDTCTLLPIFKRYFKEKLPGSELVPKILKPNLANQGLDDWDQVLAIARSALNGIDVKPDAVYVSHQAGTPAISSAVQFVSLTRFRDKVSFLVSNEYRTELTKLIPSSTYLRGIQVQEAIALLNNFNYTGIKDILGLSNSETLIEKRIKYLLDASIQWNFAEFQKFKKITSKHSLIPQAIFPWWRLGYESAYLAWVRLQQGNTVDAMFHAFRAVEGVAGLWAEQNYGNDIVRDPRKGLQLKQSILIKLPSMRSWFQSGQTLKRQIGIYGKSLFALLRDSRPEWNNNVHITVFCECINASNNGKDIFEWRNNLYHRLEGLQPTELFEAWNTQTEEGWLDTLVGCLNFITGQEFASLKEASLMAQVHEQLESAIAMLLHSPE